MIPAAREQLLAHGQLARRQTGVFFKDQQVTTIFHVRTHGGFRSFTNPYYDQSRFSAVPAGRLELQSYAARNNERSQLMLGIIARLLTVNPIMGFQAQSPNKGGARRNASPLVDQDELSMIDYDSEDVEKQGELLQADTNLHDDKDSRWISVSHVCMEEDGGVRQMYHSTPHGGHDHELSLGANRSTSHYYVPDNNPYDDIDQALEYVDEENDEAARRQSRVVYSVQILNEMGYVCSCSHCFNLQ
uniref:Uncharacterized protein n=1 Tax=Salix viminalis TaxID=40686 RepID=A0A6N2K5S0_SALVM